MPNTTKTKTAKKVTNTKKTNNTKKENSVKGIKISRKLESKIPVKDKIKKIDFVGNVKELKNYKLLVNKVKENKANCKFAKYNNFDSIQLKNYFVSNSILVMESKLDKLSYLLTFNFYSDSDLVKDLELLSKSIKLDSSIVKDKKAIAFLTNLAKIRNFGNNVEKYLDKIRSNGNNNNIVSMFIRINLSDKNYKDFESSESYENLRRYYTLLGNNIAKLHKQLKVRLKDFEYSI